MENRRGHLIPCPVGTFINLTTLLIWVLSRVASRLGRRTPSILTTRVFMATIGPRVDTGLRKTTDIISLCTVWTPLLGVPSTLILLSPTELLAIKLTFLGRSRTMSRVAAAPLVLALFIRFSALLQPRLKLRLPMVQMAETLALHLMSRPPILSSPLSTLGYSPYTSGVSRVSGSPVVV